MWDLIVSVPDHCLCFYFSRQEIEFLASSEELIVRTLRVI